MDWDHVVRYIGSDGRQHEVLARELTRSQAVRLKCLDCCNGQIAEITRCAVRDCPLYPYRGGPARKIVGLIRNNQPRHLEPEPKCNADEPPAFMF